MYQTDQGAYWQAQLMFWGPKVLIALLIIVATWIVARAVKWALQKAIDKSPALKKHVTGTPEETVGHQLGVIAKLIIWLVGIMAALQYLGIGQILAPINQLNAEIFSYLDNILGAGVLFFIGLIVARIVRRLVETVLIATNVDGMMPRIVIGDAAGTVPRPAERVPPGAAPGAPRASLARAVGVLVYALIIIPVAIAALQALGIEAISGPAIAMLDQIRSAIPHVFAAALWIGIAFIAARFLKAIIEAILPPTGFDQAILSTGVLPATARPSRIVANIAMIAIILAASIEAARQLGGDEVAAFLKQITITGSQVIFGSLIIVAGVFIARIISNLTSSSTGEGNYAETLIHYGIVALFSFMGLSFMGLAPEIVTLAFGLILGAVAVAAALAFGLGGPRPPARIVQRLSANAGPPAPPPAPRRIRGISEPDDSQPPLV